MQPSSDRSSTEPTDGDQPTARRRWEKPRILFREPLEAVAAACLPSPPGKSAGVCAIASS